MNKAFWGKERKKIFQGFNIFLLVSCNIWRWLLLDKEQYPILCLYRMLFINVAAQSNNIEIL